MARGPVAMGWRPGTTTNEARMTLTAVAQQLDRLTRLKPGKTPIISCYLKIEARDRARG